MRESMLVWIDAVRYHPAEIMGLIVVIDGTRFHESLEAAGVKCCGLTIKFSRDAKRHRLQRAVRPHSRRLKWKRRMRSSKAPA